LLAWAYEAGAWVLEDDYDGEFRYNSRPLPALQSLDRRGRVIYAGTFSKVLFPGLRLGYLVIPDELVELLRKLLFSLYLDAPRLVPAIVTEFMTAGHFARHIRRMRQVYAERRAALSTALAHRLEDVMRIELQAGGMHLIGWLKSPVKDVHLAQRAQTDGLSVSALSTWRIRSQGEQALLLSFTNIPVHAARAASERLARAIK
jgi:GntR family transcriptional regulator/MocR family aminotransferase